MPQYTDGHLVYVVDDDDRVREALLALLSAAGYRAMGFATATDYLAFARPELPACLVLDLNLPDINGIDVQKLIAGGTHPPVVFVTGYGDVRTSVTALRMGAINFISKPFSKDELLESIGTGLVRDLGARAQREESTRLQSHLSRLTPREREVLPLVVGGMLNKQAASRLGISEVTLQVHRRKIMQKMEAASLADLVRMATKLGIEVEASRRGSR